MPFTEAQVAQWLKENWPSLVIAVSVGTIYVVAFLRLHAFLNVVSGNQKSISRLKAQFRLLRSAIQDIVVNHVTYHPDDLKSLRDTIKKLEEEHDDDVS